MDVLTPLTFSTFCHTTGAAKWGRDESQFIDIITKHDNT
jgi:hypothetical protein